MYEDSAWYVDTENDILEVLRKISEDKSLLETMRQIATIMAEKKLDYRVLANRYLH